MKKKIFSLILAVFMVATFGINSFAALGDNGDILEPNWAYMSRIEIDINFSGTAGLATVEIDRIYNVTTQISATLYVYEKIGAGVWAYVDSVSGSSARSLGLEVDFTATGGKTYKAVVDVTATGIGGSESDSLAREKTCPSLY